jgi:hypothetical protein
MVISFQSTFARDQYVSKDIGHRGYVSLGDAAKRLSSSPSRVLELVKQCQLNAYSVPLRGGAGEVVILESSIQLYPPSSQLGVGSDSHPKCPGCNDAMQQVAREIDREKPPSAPPGKWRCDSCRLAVTFDSTELSLTVDGRPS